MSPAVAFATGVSRVSLSPLHGDVVDEVSVGHSVHRLKAFGVQGCLTGLTSIDNIPVLRSNNRHIHHLEGHVQCLEGCRGTSSPANRDGGRRLSGDVGAVGIESPLNDGQHGTVGLAPINRRAHNQRITFGELGADAIADIVIESARPGILLAGVAGDTSPDRFVADPYRLAVNAVLFQLFGHFGQCDGRIAPGTGTSVNE